MKKALLFMAVPFALAACNRSDGDAYVGKWEKISGRGMNVEISRNGGAYIYGHEVPDFQNGGIAMVKQAAVMKDGVLHIDAGFMSIDAVIDKNSGHLLIPGEELRRAGK
jgi:hypothetical protein